MLQAQTQRKVGLIDHGVVSRGASAIAERMAQLNHQRPENGHDEVHARTGGGNVYDLCNSLVAQTRPDESGVIFLPFLYGCNVSLDGKAGFFGLDGWQTRGHVLRAIYEGIVFSHRWHMERLLQFRAPPEQIRLSGGAARSEIWVQMFADILQTPVAVPSGTELGAMMERVGFRRVAMHGDLDGAAYDQDAVRLVATGVKSRERKAKVASAKD